MIAFAVPIDAPAELAQARRRRESDTVLWTGTRGAATLSAGLVRAR
jgi:hypothetical protein